MNKGKGVLERLRELEQLQAHAKRATVDTHVTKPCHDALPHNTRLENARLQRKVNLRYTSVCSLLHHPASN